MPLAGSSAPTYSENYREGIKADDLEGIYKSAHAAIRKDPSFKKKENTHKGPHKAKSIHRQRLSLRQRRDRVKQKKASHEKAGQ